MGARSLVARLHTGADGSVFEQSSAQESGLGSFQLSICDANLNRLFETLGLELDARSPRGE